jgi:hypothetical protein
LSTWPARDAGFPGKVRPVIRTYSAPLPLTNPTFFQPMAAAAGPSNPTSADFGFDAGVDQVHHLIKTGKNKPNNNKIYQNAKKYTKMPKTYQNAKNIPKCQKYTKMPKIYQNAKNIPKCHKTYQMAVN